VCLVAISVASCSRATPPAAAPAGRIIVALTIDWEGAEATSEELATLSKLRTALGAAPLTHFVSAAYLTANRTTATTIAGAIRPGDELAVHLHAWHSLARASGIEPRLSPSFLTGTDQLLKLDDPGFDVDLDTYEVAELRAMLRTSRRLLEQIGVPVSRSFRAGAYLATPKVLLALGAEGYRADSSAVDPHLLDELGDSVLPDRLAQLWPRVLAATQPYFMQDQLVEMPIAAVADYSEVEEIVGVLEQAYASLQKQPNRDVFVVLAFHLETADEFTARLTTALSRVGTRKQLTDKLIYMTIEDAAEVARLWLAGK